MVTAARSAGLDTPVPSCPDWDVTALLRHVGKIHRWVAQVIATGDMNTPRPEGTAPRGPELFEWIKTGRGRAVRRGHGEGSERPRHQLGPAKARRRLLVPAHGQ